MNPHQPGQVPPAGPDVPRRQFLRAAGALGAGAALGLPPAAQAAADQPQSGERKGVSKDSDNNAGAIPLRPLGRTGAKVSALGMGGHHLCDMKTVEEAIRVVHEAVDAGITFY